MEQKWALNSEATLNVNKNKKNYSYRIFHWPQK